MRLLNGIVLCVISMVVSMVAFAGTACAQDRLVPAGTLLRCVMDGLNSSSATSAVGDPVLCRLRTLEQFGRPVFPKGAMLGGHLEDLKDPGRFSGKGYAIAFDRVILPYGDLAVPAKVIQAKKVKVSKTGDINSQQDAKRHSGWLMPPLWTWKLVSVPVRGPRPQVKSEEHLELRIMDDILIPATLVYGSMKPDHPPYMGSTERNVHFDSEGKSSLGLTMLVLKSDEVYAIRKFHVDGGVLKFEDSSGAAGVVDANEIDWLRTGEMTSGSRSAVIASLVRAQ
jgi:hypothetical protein